jgi:hypothetical protein
MEDQPTEVPAERPRRITIPASKILALCDLADGEITWAWARVNEVEFEVTVRPKQPPA